MKFCANQMNNDCIRNTCEFEFTCKKMLNIQTDSISLGLCRNGEIIKYQKRSSAKNDDLISMERERPWSSVL